MTRRLVIVLAPLLAGAALTGCSMEPAYHTPATPAPPTWPVGDAYLKQSEAVLPSYSYRDVFADPRLNKILDQALANNEDVKTAIASIETARAQYRIQRAELLPQLDAGAGFARTKSGPGSPANAFNAQLSVTNYEIDIFGRIRSLTGAARDRLRRFAHDPAVTPTHANCTTVYLWYSGIHE